MATIVHFDIAADDPKRAKKFYEDLFSWKIYSMGGFNEYYEIETTNQEGMSGVGGGITKREYPGQNGMTVFIGVQSVEETIAKLNTLGGKVVQPKHAVPGYGYLAICEDTESNLFGLFQEDKQASGKEARGMEIAANKG